MSSINASVGSGIAYNSDNTSTLQLGTGGSAAVSIDTNQNVTAENNLIVNQNLSIGGNLSLTSNLILGTNAGITAGNISITGNLTSNGSAVPNLVQLYTYALALG